MDRCGENISRFREVGSGPPTTLHGHTKLPLPGCLLGGQDLDESVKSCYPRTEMQFVNDGPVSYSTGAPASRIQPP